MTLQWNVIKFINAKFIRGVVDSSWNVTAHGDAREGKVTNGVGSQYSSYYLGTWCIQHYCRWWAHLGCASSRLNWRPPRRFKWTRPFRPKDEIWFLRVCHHISTGLWPVLVQRILFFRLDTNLLVNKFFVYSKTKVICLPITLRRPIQIYIYIFIYLFISYKKTNMYDTLTLNLVVNLIASASIGKQRGRLFEVFHLEVLPVTIKIIHVGH
jgi:hypothetical protein